VSDLAMQQSPQRIATLDFGRAEACANSMVYKKWLNRVDGGAVAQMFLYPPSIGLHADLKHGPLARERHAYLIRNSRLDPEWASAGRSIQ
jgi:hypothetical protein